MQGEESGADYLYRLAYIEQGIITSVSGACTSQVYLYGRDGEIVVFKSTEWLSNIHHIQQMVGHKGT